MKSTARRVVALMTAAMVLGQCPDKIEAQNLDASHQQDECSNYVIVTDDKAVYDKVLNEYSAEAEQSEELAEEYMITAEMSEKDAERLSRLNGIECVEEDISLFGASRSNDTGDSINSDDLEWNLDIINAENDIKKKDKNTVKVAVIDSGIDYTNGIDVKERKNFVPGEDNVSILYEDATGHGTSVAGVIAAPFDTNPDVQGIDSSVELYSAKVLDENNSAPVSRVVEGIYWAIEQKVNIINLSLGTSVDSPILKKAIKEAENAGILIIASAGNDETKCVEYPAAYDEVIAVASIDHNGVHSKNSATGKEIELSAPGEKILSASCFDGEIITSGTSMATPHVVGVAARLWGKDIHKSADFIRQLMNVTANDMGEKEKYGSGIIDLAYAEKKYDEFEKEYLENDDKDIVGDTSEFENMSEIESFDVSDDVVEGRWKTTMHEELAASNPNAFSNEDLALLKTAARLPDSEKHGTDVMQNNPHFHGFFIGINANQSRSADMNYMACYVLLTKIAEAFEAQTYDNNPATVQGMNNRDYQAIRSTFQKGSFNGKAWGSILNFSASTSAKKKNHMKALVAYGFALHTATDAFAHSSFDSEGDRITHPLGADEKDYFKGRYKCASYVAQKLLVHCASGERGKLTDFVVPSNLFSVGNFYLANYATFAQNISQSVYNTYSGDFKKLAIKVHINSNDKVVVDGTKTP